MNKDLIAIFEYLEKEKGIKRELVIQAIEESLIAAAKKSVEGASNVSVQINPKTGSIDVFSEKEIVDEVELPAQEISLEDAQVIDPDAELGQFIDVVVTPKDFGRIAAQKARQIISQKLRGAERDVIYEEYRHRVGELISGTVKRFFRGMNLVIDLGKVEAIMPMRHYPKTEKFHVGEKVLALLYAVNDTENGGAEVILSRSDPEFVHQLIAREVPEIREGSVVIERIVRDPGYRTKLAVRSVDGKVDPVGACVGMRGLRVKNVMSELKSEKIDIIPFSDDPVELLQNALNPIEIRKISVNQEDGTISIVVDDENFASVIGKKGMNLRLNSELVGYEVDAQKIGDYRRTLAIRGIELAESTDPSLDLLIEEDPEFAKTLGNTLILKTLIQEGFDTPRKLLRASPEELAKIPGISLERADALLEQLRKQRG
jgi:transcription termination/antitermination protein NusA